jgi:flavodoxin
MQTATISIVYPSKLGHTKQAAKLLADTLQLGEASVHVISVDVRQRGESRLIMLDLIFTKNFLRI